MTDLDGTSVVASVAMGYARREYDSPLGISEETENPWSVLPSLFAVMPIGEGDYVAGLGITVPFGRSSDYEDDVIFGAFSPYYGEQWVININPSIATKLGENVAVAIGASVYQSDLMFKQALPWSFYTMNPMDPTGAASFEGDGVGYGANAAITWKVTEKQTLALTYRSAFDIEYEGDFTATQLPDSLAGLGATSSSDFETEIKYPSIVTLGYGIEITDTFRVAIDVEWLEHSRNDEMVIDIGNNTFLLPSDTIPQDWDDNWTYGFSAEWDVAQNWSARVGYIYLETPTKSETTLPIASEEDQSVVSVGLGFDNGTHAVNVAYAIGIFDGMTVDDNVVPAVNGEYDFESHIASVSYGYTF
jgi:long-chain fatty acid transport protein